MADDIFSDVYTGILMEEFYDEALVLRILQEYVELGQCVFLRDLNAIRMQMNPYDTEELRAYRTHILQGLLVCIRKYEIARPSFINAIRNVTSAITSDSPIESLDNVRYLYVSILRGRMFGIVYRRDLMFALEKLNSSYDHLTDLHNEDEMG